MVAELPRPHHENAPIAVVDAVLELPSAEIQLGIAGICGAPECAALCDGLHARRNLDQKLERARAQFGRHIDVLLEVNGIGHTRTMA